MKVKDMMHKGAECVAPNATLQQVARKMRDHDIGAIPVCEGGKPMGIVTDRDVTIRALAKQLGLSRTTVSEALRGLPSIQRETAKRVCAAAEKAGYRANPMASAVMSQIRRSRAQ